MYRALRDRTLAEH